MAAFHGNMVDGKVDGKGYKQGVVEDKLVV
jgi:hypothetical protein